MNAALPRAPRAIRFAGVAAVLVFLGLVARFWHPVYRFTSLVQFDDSAFAARIPALRDQPVYVYHDTGGYDGLYYAQIAFDPALRDVPSLRPAMDNLSYRARRILPSALAWLFAAGQPAWILHVYALLNVVAWLALATILWQLLAVADFRSWLAWAGVLFSAGALGSVRLALTDLVALAFLAWALLAAERSRPRSALGGVALAALSRETSLLGAAALLRRPWFSVANLARLVAVVAPLALWLAYIRARVGPADQGWSNLARPLAGLAEKWGASVAAALWHDDAILAWTTLLATVALTVQAFFFLRRWRFDDPWWRIGAAYGALLLGLGTAVWEGFPGAATRVLLPLTLAFNVAAVRTRAALLWLVLGNLGVASGLLMLRDVPEQELAAARDGRFAAIARLGPGWFGVEHHRAHRWTWTNSSAELRFETWPAVACPLTLECGMRSLVPRTITVTQDGRQIWQGRIGEKLTPVTVRFTAHAGTTIRFASDTPAVRENDLPNARPLVVALYDPRLVLAPP
ncbi:MAG TPA: hypothetical protein VHD62_18845 [Opitutaceae bacterium]|nr:hypothetical protein [Opitutaceae bacterium]